VPVLVFVLIKVLIAIFLTYSSNKVVVFIWLQRDSLLQWNIIWKINCLLRVHLILNFNVHFSQV
jgi:hypothetical protein